MRIAFVGTRGIPARYGGFETAVEEIATRMARRGHTAIVYGREKTPLEDPPPGLESVHMPCLRIRSAETLSHTFLSLAHVLVHRVDVVLVFNPANGPLCIPLWVLRKPFGVNVDGLEWRRGKWGRMGQRYLKFAAWLCTRIATAIIADSRGIQDYYRRRFNRDSFLASYGTYLEESVRPDVLREYGLEKDQYFLVVARLEPENNTDLIIRAFEAAGGSKTLVIVGDVTYESTYLRELKSAASDRVVFLGGIYDQAKLTEIICNCFAYIHGHEVGGTNPVLLRVLGCGAGVLFLDNPFNREVAEGCGIPFEKSEESLASEMRKLEAEPARAHSLAERGRERVQSRYTWDEVTDRYEELCSRLASKQRG